MEQKFKSTSSYIFTVFNLGYAIFCFRNQNREDSYVSTISINGILRDNNRRKPIYSTQFDTLVFQ